MLHIGLAMISDYLRIEKCSNQYISSGLIVLHCTNTHRSRHFVLMQMYGFIQGALNHLIDYHIIIRTMHFQKFVVNWVLTPLEIVLCIYIKIEKFQITPEECIP